MDPFQMELHGVTSVSKDPEPFLGFPMDKQNYVFKDPVLCLIMYPFQMEFHGVKKVYPWSHEMYPRIHLAILDPEPFLGVANCILKSV